MSQIAQRAIAESYIKRQQHNIGKTITVQYFGRMITGKIIEVLSYGDVIIETSSTYRIRVNYVFLDTIRG